MTLTAMFAGVAAVQAGCGILGACTLVQQQLQQKLLKHLLSGIIAAALSTIPLLDCPERMTE